MKMPILTCLVFFLILCALHAQTPSPAEFVDPLAQQHDASTIDAAVNAVDVKQGPWWQRSNEITTALREWLKALTGLVMALLVAVGIVGAKLKSVLGELRSGSKPMLALLILFALALSGCVSTTDPVTGVTTSRWDSEGTAKAIELGLDGYNRVRYQPNPYNPPYGYPVQPVAPQPVIIR
jgi:hypothetical protein